MRSSPKRARATTPTRRDVGVGLAKVVAARHGGLDGNSYKVLIYMALVALDQPNGKGQPAGLYFGGWEPLALALGWELPADDDKSPEANRRRRKLRNYVVTALGKLRERGLIEPQERARTGVRQRYRLNLDSTPASGAQSTPASGAHLDPSEWGDSTPASGAPRTHEEQGEDLPQDSTTHPSASPTGRAGAGADVVERHAFVGEPGDDCEACGLGYANRTHIRGAA